MAYTTIDNPSEFFSTTLYTGDGSADQSMTGAGFKPDFLWIKRRNASERHVLTNAQMDVSSGAYTWLDSSDNSAQFSGGTGVASFDSDGFTIKTSDSTWNTNSSTYVFWSWKANGGTGTTNNDGNRTTTVQANTTAGTSIVTYLSNGSASSQTLGHGLGAAPDLILSKRKGATANWLVYHKSLGAGSFIYLNSNVAQSSSSPPYQATPTSTVFSTQNAFQATDNFVSYCFAEKQGFSKFSSYVGNGNGDGPFVYTGFKPAFVMIKPTSYVEAWVIIDAERNPYNQAMLQLNPNSNGAEYNGASVTNGIDILSNGFKVRTSRTELNTSGGSLIYMAFAENPFVTSTGIPTTAR
jgi:hypothetical protein